MTWHKEPTEQVRLDAHKTRHENSGTDEISVIGLSGLLADDQHVLDAEVTAVAVAHALATAANDFLVASGSGAYIKKTLAETLTILGKAVASGLASLDGSSLVVQNPANATATPTASKIPIADGSAKLDGWVTVNALSYSRTFHVNEFQYAYPSSGATESDVGAYIAPEKTSIIYLCLPFLKVGDVITAYTLKGCLIETNAITVDCKLIQTNLADPPTTTDITNGAITQVTADGVFEASANPDDTTVATDKQYKLKITVITGVGDDVYITGAEVTVTRLI